MGIEERFWRKVSQGPGCWEWTGSTATGGYGTLGRGARGTGSVRAHRLSWELHRGPVPDDMVVMHKCDNRRCVNPEHLELGTRADNQRDMARKGRGDNQYGRASAEKVARVRASLLLCCATQREIARDVGVSQRLVSRIKRGARR